MKIQENKLLIIAVILIAIFYFILDSIQFDIYPSVPHNYNFRITLAIFSGIISLLIILCLKGNAWKYLHFIWIFLVIYILNFYFVFEKKWEYLDFAIGSKVEFEVKQIQDTEFWTTNQLIIGRKDTIYYSQNKNIEEVWTDEELKNIEIRKSITQPHYFLRLKKN